MTVSTVTGRPASTGPAAVHTSTGPNSRNSMTTPRPSNIVVPGSDRVNGLWEHLAHHAGGLLGEHVVAEHAHRRLGRRHVLQLARRPPDAEQLQVQVR